MFSTCRLKTLINNNDVITQEPLHTDRTMRGSFSPGFTIISFLCRSSTFGERSPGCVGGGEMHCWSCPLGGSAVRISIRSCPLRGAECAAVCQPFSTALNVLAEVVCVLSLSVAGSFSPWMSRIRYWINHLSSSGKEDMWHSIFGMLILNALLGWICAAY